MFIARINDEPVDRAASEAGGQIAERRADCSVAGRQVAERRADCSVAGRQVAERRADCSVAGGYWWSTAVIVQQDSGAGTSCGVFGPVRCREPGRGGGGRLSAGWDAGRTIYTEKEE